jgi:uncharacterized protein (UPF0261 family)
MSTTIAILATLDTKGQEVAFMREQITDLGSAVCVIDVGVTGQATTAADVPREEVATLGGTTLSDLLANPTREVAAPVMAAGATISIQRMIDAQQFGGVVGLGGLQGTALCTQVMRALPYGVAKIMVSTVASGDTAAYVDVKDITMMFSVSDILGLNPFTRQILANACGAIHGMAAVGGRFDLTRSARPVIGMTNLGVLTQGARVALQRFEQAGCEVVVFHAVGSGGRAMEQMMKEGIISGVFDYAMGEIADELFGGLRAGGQERLTVAGKLGLPQVLCPGGAEHLGLLVDPPNSVPQAYRDHTYVFHNPVVFVPRLKPHEIEAVANDICKRLKHTRNDATMMIPLGGTGSYAKAGGPLHDPESDEAFFNALRAAMPSSVEVVERDAHAEDEAFVIEAVDRLVAMVVQQKGGV